MSILGCAVAATPCLQMLCLVFSQLSYGIFWEEVNKLWVEMNLPQFKYSKNYIQSVKSMEVCTIWLMHHVLQQATSVDREGGLPSPRPPGRHWISAWVASVCTSVSRYMYRGWASHETGVVSSAGWSLHTSVCQTHIICTSQPHLSLASHVVVQPWSSHFLPGLQFPH